MSQCFLINEITVKVQSVLKFSVDINENADSENFKFLTLKICSSCLSRHGCHMTNEKESKNIMI
jgi:hypothetical protein